MPSSPSPARPRRFAWRCEVEHIQSGQVWSFPSLQDGLRFIARQCEGR